MVSVIIPVYNNAQWIRKCVESVLAQTYTNFEIIIVDDGSDDNPQEQLADINDPRLHPIMHLPHGGVSAARNAGIDAARGDYIIFIDGDDWVEPNHIEALISGIESGYDCSLIKIQVDTYNASHIHPDVEKVFSTYSGLLREDFNILFDSFLLASPCNKIYLRRLVTDNDPVYFDLKSSYGEDLIFNLKYFAKISSIKISNYATYHYVKRHGCSGTSRFHLHTSHILDLLIRNTNITITTKTDKTRLILLNYFIWGVLNIYNRNSTLSQKEKLRELHKIMSMKEYRQLFYLIPQTNLSSALKLLFSIKNSFLIHFGMSYLS